DVAAKAAGKRIRSGQSTIGSEIQQSVNEKLQTEIQEILESWSANSLPGNPPTVSSNPTPNEVTDLKKLYNLALINKNKEEINVLKKDAKDVGMTPEEINSLTTGDTTPEGGIELITVESSLDDIINKGQGLLFEINNLTSAIEEKINETKRAQQETVDAFTKPLEKESNTAYYYLLALKRAPEGVMADFPDNIRAGDFVKFKRVANNANDQRVFYVYKKGNNKDHYVVTMEE
ncbi:MAG TPA: hypothetical protein DCM40_30210, partial [Maribacter sp.]|nr:hypothetical protein [Maribacter sp.]